MSAVPVPPMPPPADPPGLRSAVGAALETLADLTALPASVVDGRVEQMLRAALDRCDRDHAARRRAKRWDPGADRRMLAAAAVRAACAHLASRSLEDAYLALLTASDHLRGFATD